jgi:hypothetical protein
MSDSGSSPPESPESPLDVQAQADDAGGGNELEAETAGSEFQERPSYSWEPPPLGSRREGLIVFPPLVEEDASMSRTPVTALDFE